METTATPIKREKLYNLITATLAPDREMTAREIATELYIEHCLATPTRQEVAPRLTELLRAERVEVCGTKYDEDTRKHVSVYRITNK